jgi:hypothetical protein
MQSERKVLLALTINKQYFVRGVVRYAREHDWYLVTDMMYTGRVPLGWRGDGILTTLGYRKELADFIKSAGVSTVAITLVNDKIPLAYAGAAMLDRLMQSGRPPMRVLRIPPKGVVTRHERCRCKQMPSRSWPGPTACTEPWSAAATAGPSQLAWPAGGGCSKNASARLRKSLP